MTRDDFLRITPGKGAHFDIERLTSAINLERRNIADLIWRSYEALANAPYRPGIDEPPADDEAQS